jgi:hypothetical protein
VIVECGVEQAERKGLVQVMKDGMDAVVNVMESHTLLEVEVSASWRASRPVSRILL